MRLRKRLWHHSLNPSGRPQQQHAGAAFIDDLQPLFPEVHIPVKEDCSILQGGWDTTVTPSVRHQINAIDPDTAIAATGKMTGLIIAHHALWYAPKSSGATYGHWRQPNCVITHKFEWRQRPRAVEIDPQLIFMCEAIDAHVAGVSAVTDTATNSCPVPAESEVCIRLHTRWQCAH